MNDTCLLIRVLLLLVFHRAHVIDWSWKGFTVVFLRAMAWHGMPSPGLGKFMTPMDASCSVHRRSGDWAWWIAKVDSMEDLAFSIRTRWRGRWAYNYIFQTYILRMEP